MERIELPLSQLTLGQKLDLMETLWGNLTTDESNISPPGWHAKILADREKSLAAGTAKVSLWVEAKERIRERVMV